MQEREREREMVWNTSKIDVRVGKKKVVDLFVQLRCGSLCYGKIKEVVWVLFRMSGSMFR